MQRTVRQGWPGFLAVGCLAQVLLNGCACPLGAPREPAILLPLTQRGRVEVQVVPEGEPPSAPAEPHPPVYRALSAEE